uniref:Clathrin light chain n=1 Tax=Bursaphelenchus xylophilus TaxID=6326 RepID=A0A1I7SNG4_BURXY
MEFRHHWTVFWTNGQFFTGLMSPNNVGQASGHRSSPASERQAHSAQAEQLPAVMAPPLVGQNPTGVPEEGKEGSSSTTGPSGFGPEPAPTDQADHLPAVEGSERSLDMDFSSFSNCSSSTSEEHSTLHDVPSIRSLEVFDEGAACEETLADQNDRLRFQRDFWKTQCRTLWERQETFEKKVRFYQEALGEAEVEAKKAKEAASVATKKAEEERALKEAAEKEVAELQALHRQHLRTAVADDRPPRAERSRSRSPLMTTAWSITPTT